MTYLRDDLTLWAATAPEDRTVWFGTGSHSAVGTKMTAEEFTGQSWVQDANAVRVLGSAENAELILRLWNMKLGQKLPIDIYIAFANPKLTDAVGDGSIPSLVSQMRHINLSPSCGGWRLMTPADFSSFALVEEVKHIGDPVRPTDLLLKILRAHPAYPALSFVPTSDLAAGAALLAEILDPRKYVDPLKPDRRNKLYWHLGLGAPESRHLCAKAFARQGGGTAFSDVYKKVSKVVHAWTYEGMFDNEDIYRPENFLMRLVTMFDRQETGIRAASKVFVDFIRAVWLDRSTEQRNYVVKQGVPRLQPMKSYGPELFVPQYFFSEEDTAAAWYGHCRKHVNPT